MAKIKQIINGDDKFVQSGAIIELTSGDLVTISNALYCYFKDKTGMNENKRKLKDIIHIASQISQYGHMDEWAVSVLNYVAENNKEDEKENANESN